MLTAAGFGGLFALSRGSQGEDVVTRVSGGFLALSLGAALADYVFCGLRHHVFLRRLVPGTRLWLPIRADLVGRFTGAVTPSQTGGGPGQIFVLYRGGIPLPTILSILAINFMATLLFLGVSGGVAIWVLGDRVSSVVVGHLVRWGFLVMVAMIGFLALSVTRPDLVARPLQALARRLEGRAGFLAEATRRGSTALVDSAERYKTSCIRCFREWPALPVIAVVLTFVVYVNRFTLAWLILRGLGFEGSYLLTVTVHAVLQLILYVAPTPGGSGIAELSTGALMALLLPTAALAPFTLVYRFFLTYLPAALGAVLLARELRTGRDG